MRLNKKILWVFFFLMPLLVVNTSKISASETDDYVPEITAKVSRISFLTGDVKIRRLGSDEWERAVLNLPVVEGDEIATEANALLEIQFDRDNYVRLAQNSYLKISNLKDEGVALSISQGSLNVTVLNFDADEKYFEIDAPDTTVSILREGMYRIDAGDADSREVRVSVTEKGEARVYSVNSGFTLKSGRTARIKLEGNLAGEWETADASRYFDEFDEWAVKRDALIAKRLKDAYYDKYYDRDIYGAEDLNDYGEWIYARDYGYVWRPYQTSVSSYQNWSPYRYGHWRWIPPYGWTWINDEPWGWATYHHGRWVYYNSFWVWTPYEYNRPRRSWWSPALVVFASYGNNVCWYPLPHRSRYYGHRNRNRGNRNNNAQVGNNPNPVVTPTPAITRDPSIGNMIRNRQPGGLNIPASAVVSVPVSDFGRNTKGFGIVPSETAKRILAKEPNADDNIPLLPTYTDLNGRVSREIRAEKPPVVKTAPNTRIGATTRTDTAPLDNQLRQRQIFGNRQPVETRTNSDVKGADNGTTEPRRTGSVNRPVVRQDRNDTVIQPPPSENVPQRTSPSRTNTRKSDINNDPPPQIYTPPARQEQPKREEPRSEPPPPRETPRIEPPRREEPKSEPPPRREEPKNDPPAKRDDPPPSRSEPKNDPNPVEIRPGKKDNR